MDHVVTPAIGLGWMIAEDALDQYLVRFVERKTHNRYLRALVRGGANPKLGERHQRAVAVGAATR